MKNYNKPSIKYVELRLEEGLAGIGSVTVFQNDNNKPMVDLISPEVNWPNFWLKVLRKK